LDQSIPKPRLAPLPYDTHPELSAQFEASRKRHGFVPNSLLIMQRKPKMVQALGQLTATIWDPDSTVDLVLKRLISMIASNAAGCRYCTVHNAEAASDMGVDGQKLAAVWEYQTSPLFSVGERAALDVAVAAGCTPNAVTDEMFEELKKHWSEEQIVEIVGAIAHFGFLNRWNDTFATPLESDPMAFGEQHLSEHGWDAGRHRR
jgi:uncharacterized peroxidase-related enzyme